MDVLESRIPRPDQPDHGLYIWPANMYIEEHLKHFRKAQTSLTLGALARGIIDYDATKAFMKSGLHEEVEGLPVIPGEHIPTALRVFEREDYYNNYRALSATGLKGVKTTLLLRPYFSLAQINAARAQAQEVGSLTPIMEWVNAEGYLATRGSDGTLTIKAHPYNREKDRERYELKRKEPWQWEARCSFVNDCNITHFALRYPNFVDSESNPLPLGYDPQSIVEELGWVKDGVFKSASPPSLYTAKG